MTEQITYTNQASQAFLRVRGPDAEAFLHAQLAIDVTGLAGNGARLAPWLNAKGRVTALFGLARLAADDWLLSTPASLIDDLGQRLRMFVLRSAVQVQTETDRQARVVCVGSGPSPLPCDDNGHDWIANQGVLCRRTTPGCLELWGTRPELDQLTAAWAEDAEVGKQWCREWVAQGWPRIEAASRDRFTAHMLNLDLLGAVSFTKGCYPGQEVVARTQNLGRPKRRTLLFSCATELPQPGQALVDGAGRSWGEILVSAAGAPHLALAVVTVADLPTELMLAAAVGAKITRAEPPYPIPEL